MFDSFASSQSVNQGRTLHKMANRGPTALPSLDMLCTSSLFMARATVAGTVTEKKDVENINVNNGKENIQNTSGIEKAQSASNLRAEIQALIQNTNVNNGIISEPEHDVTELDGSVRKFESDVPVLGNLCLGVLHVGEAAVGMEPTLSCEGLCVC